MASTGFLSILVLLGILNTLVEGGTVSAPLVYRGMSDASGAVPLGTNFFAAADDESNPLRIYRREAGGPPVKVVDLSGFLGYHRKDHEMDLEAGTLMGTRAFWISSHGCNQEGRNAPRRHRLFATDVAWSNGEVDLVPVGKPYTKLLSDLIAAPQLSAFNLAQGAQQAPKSFGAVNIEGLCATPDQQLLIGFRNPVPNGLALLVPIRNPQEVIRGKRAVLGNPILLDLGGLGIRDITFYHGTYVIIAGSYHEKGPFKLFQWPGGKTAPQEMKGISFHHMNPEAIIIYPDKGLSDLQLLSDDGTRMINGTPAKELPFEKRQFRSVWVRP